MKFIKLLNNEANIELKQNEYFASCILGAKYLISDNERKYMTESEYYLRLCQKTSNNEIYITKNKNVNMFNKYGLNCIVSADKHDKVCILS